MLDSNHGAVIGSLRFPLSLVDRSTIEVDLSSLDPTDVVFEVIPISYQDVSYVNQYFQDDLTSRYLSNNELPANVSMLDDTARSHISDAIVALVNANPGKTIPREAMYECPIVVERWLRDELGSFTRTLSETSYVRGLKFPQYIDFINQYSVPTVLSAVIGRTPRILRPESLHAMSIDLDGYRGPVMVSPILP